MSRLHLHQSNLGLHLAGNANPNIVRAGISRECPLECLGKL